MSKRVSKNGWTQVAFGDVVRLSRKRSNDPLEDGFDRYVGLDHLDPGDLKIRRWGNTADGTTFTSVFRAGQVLFGKRRAYQRKIAVADFDGVCSGDIYVLEPKDRRLLPEVLPFICQTDSFFAHAVGTSAGSLSPRTNWESLASYQFALPSVAEQARIATVLQSASSAAQLHDEIVRAIQENSSSLLYHFVQGAHLSDLAFDEVFGRYSPLLPLTRIGDLLRKAQYGLSEPSSSGGRYRMLRMMDLSDGFATGDDLCSLDLSDEEFERYRLERGDVLFNRTNSHDLVGRTGIYMLKGNHVFASYLVRLKTDETKLLPAYLSAFLNGPLGRRQVMRFATKGVSQSNVNVSNLRNVLIPLPPLDYQQHVVESLQRLRLARLSHQQRGLDARELAAKIVRRALAADR